MDIIRRRLPARLMIVLLSALMPVVLFAQDEAVDAEKPKTMSMAVPDLRDEQVPLKAQRGDFVVVPIPISSPTFGTGLVAAGAYFYGQTEEQKKVQPASLTGLGGAYTDNESWAAAVAQQSYWDGNRWRLTAVAGFVDFSLTLATPDLPSGETEVAWGIVGALFQATISRRLGDSRWYGGVIARYLAMDQDIDSTLSDLNFDLGETLYVAGLGLVAEFDRRNRPFNSQSGIYFKADAMFSTTSGDRDGSYQGYGADFRSYRSISDSVVLAWQIKGCSRSGNAPLWNACFINLRGFSITEYIGRHSAMGQAELRWNFHKRWGAAAFAGWGWAGNSFAEQGDDQNTPSYGVGGRFMVLPSQGINIRVDLAWSEDDEAIHLSVAEAF